MHTLTYTLNPVPPFRLDLTVWVLRRRPSNMIDLWDGRIYRRVITIKGQPVLAEVEQRGSFAAPELKVILSSERMPDNAGGSSKYILNRLLGLDVTIAGFYDMAAEDSHLGPLAGKFVGVRPPKYSTLFEAAANGIIGQQISLFAAMAVLNRFTEACGKPFPHPEGLLRPFPEPSDVALCDLEIMRRSGLSTNKAKAISQIARIIASGDLNRGELELMDNESASERLRKLPGIGPWTADYILLRGLGRLDIFPRKDSGALKGLTRWLKGDGPPGAPVDPGPDFINQAISRWRPYAGLVYFHLLLNGLYREGYIQ